MTTLLIGLLIPLLGTMLGASFVFFMKRDMPEGLKARLSRTAMLALAVTIKHRHSASN